jgi:hypothetical protein
VVFEVLSLVVPCPSCALAGIASETAGRTAGTLIAVYVPQVTHRVVLGTQTAIMPGQPPIMIT